MLSKKPELLSPAGDMERLEMALHYGAGIHQSDFVNQPEAVRKEINTWVSDETREKIQNLLGENAISPFTRMILVNAIYFKADWLDQFDANSKKLTDALDAASAGQTATDATDEGSDFSKFF